MDKTICETWCLILENYQYNFCSTHVLRSRLIDGDACKQCKVSLVVSGVMGGRLSLGHALTPVKNAI